jgi:ATP-dependent Lhr-like helicase
MSPEQVEHVVDWMLDKDILWEDQGILTLGREGEETFGRRNFLELFSVFMSPPLFAVLHGRQELGFVDQMSFLGKHEGPRVLLLSGRAWRVNHIDWQRHIAYVEATDAKGRSRWRGEGQGLDYRLCQSIKQVLASEAGSDRWSRRATERIDEIRQEFSWLASSSSVAVLAGAGQTEWWTFGGSRANATLARQLAQRTRGKVDFDSFKLTFQPGTTLHDVERAIAGLRQLDVTEMRPAVEDDAIDGLKFSECLPRDLAIEMLECRLQDKEAARLLVNEHVRFVSHQ